MTKERQQIIILIAISAVFVGALGYYFRDAILPHATGSPPTLPTPKRLELPSSRNLDDFMKRPDYKLLDLLSKQPVQLNGEETPSGLSIFRSQF